MNIVSKYLMNNFGNSATHYGLLPELLSSFTISYTLKGGAH